MVSLGTFIVLSVISVGFIAGIIVLQVYLSSIRDHKYGLILVFLSLAFAGLIALSFILFGASRMTVDGIVVTQGSDLNMLISAAMTFMVLNIPTLIFYLIYRYARIRNKREGIQRMRVKDL